MCTDTQTYKSKKLPEVEYVTLLIDMQKLIRNTWKIMIKRNNCHILDIGM